MPTLYHTSEYDNLAVLQTSGGSALACGTLQATAVKACIRT
jgi:hypothetical protein